MSEYEEENLLDFYSNDDDDIGTYDDFDDDDIKVYDDDNYDDDDDDDINDDGGDDGSITSATTYYWVPFIFNSFRSINIPSNIIDISNEDNIKLRDCLKHGMTINVVINRISLDGFPKTDDIRWPPVPPVSTTTSTATAKSITAGGGTGEAGVSSNDEVIYFVSAGFQGIQGYAAAYAGSIGLDTNSYTGLPQ
jgi:hypothetical protein